MGQALRKADAISFVDYLAGERDVEVRSEYRDGQVVAMAGASETHNTISADFAARINIHLPTHCRVWQADMKVVGETWDKQPFSYYPDIMVACAANTADPYYRTNPLLIIEVLSPSTQRIDLREKFRHYTQIPALQEYVVVSQDSPYVRIFRRRSGWQVEHYHAGDCFTLESIGLELPVNLIYRRVSEEVGLDLPANSNTSMPSA